MNPTAKDIGDLLWLIAAWSARFPGYSADQRLQLAVEGAILERDREALEDANRYPYLYRPSAAQEQAYREHDARALLEEVKA